MAGIEDFDISKLKMTKRQKQLLEIMTKKKDDIIYDDLGNIIGILSKKGDVYIMSEEELKFTDNILKLGKLND